MDRDSSCANEARIESMSSPSPFKEFPFNNFNKKILLNIIKDIRVPIMYFIMACE